ncbi:unnamed protein product [Pieris brassicae]|uniref:MHD domain-containing protein n=2 Tax=Pieris TaxID=7115 RepID=A0A9P0XG61_PIEBR|nr:unnamed protein product [Pieris brassicae]
MDLLNDIEISGIPEFPNESPGAPRSHYRTEDRAYTFPSQWKIALVRPIPKIQNPIELKDLRPISILPDLSKILERVVYNQLIKHCEATSNILPAFQSGFRQIHSTTTALFDVVNNLIAAQYEGDQFILALLDFSRAFECNNRPLLISKLRFYGFDHITTWWFSGYLQHQNQSVNVNLILTKIHPRHTSTKMSSSAVYILDVKGKVLISRNYRGDVDLGVIDKFMPLLMEKEEEGMLTPLLQTSECTFAYIKTNNLYIVSTTKKNANIALVFVFLYKIVEVMTEYFKELEEESIRDNFVVIYELLDELLDFGYPQTTDSKILQEYITQEGHKLEMQPRIPMAVTNAVSWRSEGIKYRKNEVFLDVIESVNLLANANGNVLRSEIVGAIKMRVYLSGMPELRLGLNDKVLFESTGRGKSKSVELEDVKFHQCVRLSRFENDRTISFIPPDGEFELMSYRLNTHVKPLIWIESVIERHAHSRVEYMIKAKSQFKRRSTANNVEIIIPVPADADSPKFKTTIGSVKYTPEQNAITWSIKSFPGGKEYLMRAHFGLPSVECEETDGKPPIQVKFEIPYFTTSGIQVRYLKIIEKSGYQALPWVRYITQNGDYQLRTN